jgi:hypothetical protein
MAGSLWVAATVAKRSRSLIIGIERERDERRVHKNFYWKKKAKTVSVINALLRLSVVFVDVG